MYLKATLPGWIFQDAHVLHILKCKYVSVASVDLESGGEFKREEEMPSRRQLDRGPCIVQ